MRSWPARAPRQVRLGKIVAQEGNKLEIEFEPAGLKKVLDSFVSAG